MFPETYHAMLQKLITKTKEKKLAWYEVNQNGEVILRYGDYVFKITRMGETLFSDYQITIDNLRGHIDLFSVKFTEERFNDVGELYTEALRKARNVEQIAKDIERDLNDV